MNWINRAENKNKWQALVSTVMNCWVPKGRKFLNYLRKCYLLKKDLLHGVG